MAGKVGGGDDDAVSDINVTPFVDVVLVLLIILMVSSSQIAKSAFEVDLPKAAAATDSVASTLNVLVTREGYLMIDGVRVSERLLETKVRNQVLDDPKVQAVIGADRGVDYGDVVRVIDLVKAAGVKSFALNVDRAEKKGGS
jgi:biopolymer transport protein ExbD